MDISSQIHKEILQITEAFKSQLYDTLDAKLDDFVDGLTNELKMMLQRLTHVMWIQIKRSIRIVEKGCSRKWKE